MGVSALVLQHPVCLWVWYGSLVACSDRMTRRQRKYVDFVVVFNVAALSRSTSPRGYGFGCGTQQQQLGRHREMGGREKNAISVDYYVKRSNVSTASRHRSLASVSDKSLQAQSSSSREAGGSRVVVRPAWSALTLALRDIELLLYSPHRNTTLVEGAAAAASLCELLLLLLAVALLAAVTRSKGAIPKFEVSLELSYEERTCGGQQKDSETSIISLGLEVFFSNENCCCFFFFCTKTSKRRKGKTVLWVAFVAMQLSKALTKTRTLLPR